MLLQHGKHRCHRLLDRVEAILQGLQFQDVVLQRFSEPSNARLEIKRCGIPRRQLLLHFVRFQEYGHCGHPSVYRPLRINCPGLDLDLGPLALRLGVFFFLSDSACR